jgi:hypothetical protein
MFLKMFREKIAFLKKFLTFLTFFQTILATSWDFHKSAVKFNTKNDPPPHRPNSTKERNKG